MMDGSLQSFFASATQVGLGVAGLLALVTLLAWIRNWPWKFSLVGYTAFTLVLTAGCFALSLGPIFRSRIPGAAPYTTVYDQGAERAVIAVSPDITPEQLILTLKQAASDLASSGRFSTGSPVFTLQPAPSSTLSRGFPSPCFWARCNSRWENACAPRRQQQQQSAGESLCPAAQLARSGCGFFR